MTYSIEPKDRVYVKGYGFSSFAKNMGKHLSSKMLKNILIAQKNQQQMQIKLLQKE